MKDTKTIKTTDILADKDKWRNAAKLIASHHAVPMAMLKYHRMESISQFVLDILWRMDTKTAMEKYGVTAVIHWQEVLRELALHVIEPSTDRNPSKFTDEDLEIIIAKALTNG